MKALAALVALFALVAWIVRGGEQSVVDALEDEGCCR